MDQEELKKKAAEGADKAKEAAGKAADKAKDAAGKASVKAKEFYGKAKESEIVKKISAKTKLGADVIMGIAGGVVLLLLVVIIAHAGGGKGGEKVVAGADGEKVIVQKINTHMSAPAKANPASDFKYDLTEDGSGIVIQKYLGTKKTKIRIPDKIEGYPVTAIGSRVFGYDFSDSKSLGTIVSDPKDANGRVNAFTGIDSGHEYWRADVAAWIQVDTPVEYLYVPRTVASIGNNAFKRVTAKVDYPDEKQFNITPQNLDIDITKLKHIGEEAFSGALFKNTDITIPASLEIESDGSFTGNFSFSGSNVTSVTISDGVEIISAGMFYDCHELKEVTIPASVKEIRGSAWGAFENCEKLEKVNIPENAQIKYVSYSAGAYDQESHTIFQGCSALTLKEREKIKASGYNGKF